MNKEFKWHIEAIRIGITLVSIVITIVWFGAKLDKQIALNHQSIETIQTNHLPHIQEAVLRIEDKIDDLTETLYLYNQN